MARKRMFDSEIIGQDCFLELSTEAKLIYFLLGMYADDEGFISPKKILMLYNGTKENLNELESSGLIIQFDTGVVLITDWNRNNYLDHSRIKETIYLDEKSKVTFDDEKLKYLCLTDVKQLLNQNRIEENSIQNSIEYNSVAKNNTEKNNTEKGSKEEVREVIVLSPDDCLCKDIIDYLNKKVGSTYKWDNKNIKDMIIKQLQNGHKKLDFQIVIDKKYDEWKNTKFFAHLRPDTLFGEKFEIYLNQPVKNKTLNDMSFEDIDNMNIPGNDNTEEDFIDDAFELC